MSGKITHFFFNKSKDAENITSTCTNSSSNDVTSTLASNSATLIQTSSSPVTTRIGIQDDISEQFQPPENFVFPKTLSGKQQRSCQQKWFKDFSWLHYDIENNSVLCFLCNKAEKSGQISAETNKDFAYISKGFRSWKKAPKCFREHELSKPHVTAKTYQIIVPRCADVSEMLVKTLSKAKSDQRRYFIKVMQCVQYLGRQGIAFLGNNNSNDNFHQLLLLRGKDDPMILEKLKDDSNKRKYKYIHPDYQLELLTIMAHQVLNMVLKPIRSNGIFSLMSDEWTDISNLEQLSICTRTVNDGLIVHENFLGFYEIPNIKSKTIVSVIKDALIRMQLPLSNCRGQTYDGASNMLGKKSGVAALILEEQPKALPTHCHAHSLSLSVKDMCKNVKILNDTMGTVGEICILVKYSPKRENMLGEIKENIDGDLDEELLGEKTFVPSLDKLCITRWTVRGKCFEKILLNYEMLMKLWQACLKEPLSTEVKARIVGCQKQMSLFSFFFGLCLGHRLFMITDNLSKTLQNETMSAVSSQKCADLTLKTFKGMRNKESFDLFFQYVKEKAAKLPVDEPRLKHKRKKPNYSILQFLDGQESCSASYHPETIDVEFRQVFFDALDHVISAIKERFNQPSFQTYSKLEELLLHGAHEAQEEIYSAGIDQLKELYDNEVNIPALKSEFFLFKNMFDDMSECFDDIHNHLLSRTKQERLLIPNIIHTGAYLENLQTGSRRGIFFSKIFAGCL